MWGAGGGVAEKEKEKKKTTVRKDTRGTKKWRREPWKILKSTKNPSRERFPLGSGPAKRR